MKLIIDIPDKIYETVQNGTYCGTLYEELKNGTPLSESEDCVSRQAVLDILDDMVKDYINENDFDKAQGIAWVKVQKLLSVSLKEPCEMTAEEYRQRMIDAFHNADCDELIALVVLPTEKEFEHLEWLLEKHYKAKPEPCTDAISRQAVLEVIEKCHCEEWVKADIGAPIEALSPVTPAEKVGQWEWVQYYCDRILGDWVCSECKSVAVEGVMKYNEEAKPTYNYCPQCGCKIQEVKNDKGRNR